VKLGGQRAQLESIGGDAPLIFYDDIACSPPRKLCGFKGLEKEL
jgi:hypothetical protein